MISNRFYTLWRLVLFLAHVPPVESWIGNAGKNLIQRAVPLSFVHDKMAEDVKHYLHWEETEKQKRQTFTLPEDSACYDPGKHLDLLYEEYKKISRDVVSGDPFEEFHADGLPANYWKETPSQRSVLSRRSSMTVSPRGVPPTRKFPPAHDNYLLKPGKWRLVDLDSALTEEGQRHEVVHWDLCPLVDDSSGHA